MTNKEVIDNLYNNYNDEKFAHLYLVETNDLNKCVVDVKNLIKKINSDNVSQENLSSLIDNNSLSSVIIVSTLGKEITKNEIDTIKTRFKNKPLLIKDNIYIIVSPEKMNPTAYNKMLKFMEEPEEHIIGFLITDNKKSVASTIISRCEAIKLLYEIDTKENDDELIVDAKRFIDVITNVTHENIVSYVNNEISCKYKTRDDIVSLLKIMYTIFNDLLLESANDVEKTISALKIIAKYLDQLNYNVNVNLMLESMTIEIGELYGI